MSKIRAYTLNNNQKEESQTKVILSVERQGGLYNFYEVSMNKKDSEGKLDFLPIDNIFDYASNGMQYSEELTNYFKENEGIERSNGKRR